MKVAEGAPPFLDAGAPASPVVDRRWIASFEDRYGEGSYQKLLRLFARPCVTFAQIATHFGVTRENVRQWHQRLLPDAPRGHTRRRLCRLAQQQRRLLSDGLFRGFYQHVRSQLPAQRLRLISGRDGFLKRYVNVDGHLVALKRARLNAPSTHEDRIRSYVLASGTVRADFIYFELVGGEYLFMPRHLVPAGTTTFRDTPRSKYQSFKNSFAALAPENRAQRVS